MAKNLLSVYWGITYHSWIDFDKQGVCDGLKKDDKMFHPSPDFLGFWWSLIIYQYISTSWFTRCAINAVVIYVAKDNLHPVSLCLVYVSEKQGCFSFPTEENLSFRKGLKVQTVLNTGLESQNDDSNLLLWAYSATYTVPRVVHQASFWLSYAFHKTAQSAVAHYAHD